MQREGLRNKQAVVDRIVAMTTALEDEFDLGWVTITHRFNETDASDRVAAETITDWEYRQASIHWYLPTMSKMTDEEVEATIIHEFVHVLQAPLLDLLPDKKKTDKMSEFTTQSLTLAIMAMRRKMRP